MSPRNGLRALAHKRSTLPAVSSPDSVVRSINVIARSSHAACHCCFTVRRVGIVAARRSTALRFTRMERTSCRSSGVPALRSTTESAGDPRDGPTRRGRDGAPALVPVRKSASVLPLAISVTSTGTGDQICNSPRLGAIEQTGALSGVRRPSQCVSSRPAPRRSGAAGCAVRRDQCDRTTLGL